MEKENQNVEQEVVVKNNENLDNEVKDNGKKKSKNPMSNKKFSIILGVSLVAVSAISVFGTIIIYDNFLKPEPPASIGVGIDYKGLVEKVENNPDTPIENLFVNDRYNMLNYALAKYAEQPYTIQIANTVAENPTGDQYVKALTVNTPEQVFNQNVSVGSSEIVKIATAVRAYEENNGTTVLHNNKVPNDWKTIPGTELVYDQYIDMYGKLLRNSYTVKADDVFTYKQVTDSTSISEYRTVNAVLDYEINGQSVEDFKYEKTEDDGYKYKVVLNTQYGCTFYKRKLKTNGGFPKAPVFEGDVNLEIAVDKDSNLISMYSEETYKATMVVTVQVTTKANINYYSAKTAADFKVDGTTITIPKIDEDFVIDMLF